MVRRLGAGNYGVALLVTASEEGQRMFVIKVSNPREADVPMAVARRLNTIPLFVKTLGYFYTESGGEWLRPLPKALRGNVPYYHCMVMDYKSEQARPIISGADLYQTKCHMLIILHGLLEARRQFQFAHNDLYERNLLFEPNRSTPARRVILSPSLVLEGVNHVPLSHRL